MKALIVYASLTGNTEEAADVVTARLEDRGVQVEMVDSLSAYGEDFQQVDICMVGTYTYGAELPEDIIDFYEDMEDLDLTGKIFGVFGSGDRDYEYFCQSVHDFYQQFLHTGAQPAGSPVTFEGGVDREAINSLEDLADAAIELASPSK